MPRAVFCPARLIMLCAVYCALRGLLCFVWSVVPCAVFCPARLIVPCTVYSALCGLLCLARFIVPCAAYCALRGLLCLARLIVPCTVYCALRGILPCTVYCAAMFIYVGVRRTTFMIDKTFCIDKAFRAPRGHTARILHGRARGLVRVMPIRGYYPPCGDHGCGKGRKLHKKPPRSDLTPLRRGSDGNYGVGFSRRLLWTVYCFTLPLPQALPRFCVPRGRTYLPPSLTSRLCR